jgi:hypothetical protein
MLRLKVVPLASHRQASRLSAAPVLLALALAAAFGSPLRAQMLKPITIIMLDGKTGQPIVPTNYIIRVNHLDAIRNEWLKLNDDGTGSLLVPSPASFLSVQGTYHNSLDIYINCDAGMEKNTHTLHWYSIPDIMKSGVVAPNECYKGKYGDNPAITAKPGQFIFFVRETSWRDGFTE